MKEKKFRHEIKHYINYSDYKAIKNRLMHIMKIDTNASENNEYKIRSLYFDNLNDKVLMEKINGVNYREKFRIRFYNDNHSFIKLEKKSKINGLCSKDSELISKEECEKILKGDIEFLRYSNKPLFIEFYSKIKGDLLKPKSIVDYVREAYIYRLGNVRITFDKKIRTGIYSTNIFDSEVPTIEAIDNNIVVLEVKYDEFLPELIQDIIQTNERRASAISKYAASRIYG
ncbi:TPA: polyphosphate polymerase domain-containing protein [Clostridium perfringens]|uniref:polyphosphate polymerase domain-containing protein n=1 Tax=Clostridium perfringens TaxID=1502 RepID=UPI001A3593E7|nr:polyphosphate polymerase domain-containing protein [Clostridium perfringens]EGT4144800.1 polyphosphate polymerase domain-containing protein [Clostridium perfringens]ELC8424277.1 polyphosphate polymerase domain-containing protein [Clostridium perfringens]ELU5586882.1 polyphosphate polymerase domain-containing protein [Clostridium perfringens]MCX0411275.1 polyphosphate polymerase domain-containing protein [Clostridium perfringens]MDU3844556.1 polyphosphate polymerase domain-containing protein